MTRTFNLQLQQSQMDKLQKIIQWTRYMPLLVHALWLHWCVSLYSWQYWGILWFNVSFNVVYVLHKINNSMLFLAE